MGDTREWGIYQGVCKVNFKNPYWKRTALRFRIYRNNFVSFPIPFLHGYDYLERPAPILIAPLLAGCIPSAA